MASKVQKPDAKYVKLVGGMFDGELLVDEFKNALDRFDSTSKKNVRYYRDPGNSSCFLVDDSADARLLIYRAREFSARMERRDKEIERLENRMESLEKIVTRLVMSQSSHRSWWRRVHDAWERAK